MGAYSVFDGYKLTLHRSDGTVVGSWDAISGAIGHQRPSEQTIKNIGPLLEGSYSFSIDQVTPLRSFDLATGAITPLLKLVGINSLVGRFPGSIWAWGTERVELSPNFDTEDRDRFFIHGGAQFGSRGCIDLGPNEQAYFAALRSLGETSHQVVVQYDPQLEVQQHPLVSSTQWNLWSGFGDYLTRPLPGLLDSWFPSGTQLQINGNTGSINYPGGNNDTIQFNASTSDVTISSVDGLGNAIATTTITSHGITVVERDIAANTQLWGQRRIEINGSDRVVADIRDYSDVANQWLVNHTFPTANLSQADETFTNAFGARNERHAYLGNMADTGAPSPLSYESYFGAGYDFSASSFAINFGQVTSVSVLDAGLGFDVSFSGGSAGPNTFKVGASVNLSSILSNLFSFFDGFEFDLFGPVILNLSGGAIDITPRQDSNVFFDVDGDGFKERTAWAGPGDGLLVIDLHGNGQPGPDGIIGQALELAFARWTPDPNDTDAQALAALFDTNHNGLLDGGDARWGEFRVWQDANQNGVTDPGELQTLGALGISSIGGRLMGAAKMKRAVPFLQTSRLRPKRVQYNDDGYRLYNQTLAA